MMKKNSNIIIMLITGLLILAAYVLGIGCPIKYMTGISCPGCGMTRAVVECIHLDFINAWYYHPLFFTLPLIIIVLFLGERIPSRIRKTMMIACIATYIAVYFIRLFFVKNTVVTIDLGQGYIALVIKKIMSAL